MTLPSGDTAYTRDGTFGMAPDGTLVTADGYTVQPGLQIPSNATGVTVNASGQVQVTLGGRSGRMVAQRPVDLPQHHVREAFIAPDRRSSDP